MPDVLLPASEYDALIDLVHTLVSEYTMDNPIEAVELVDREHGRTEAEWLRRIVIDGARARELFSDEPAVSGTGCGSADEPAEDAPASATSPRTQRRTQP